MNAAIREQPSTYGGWGRRVADEAPDNVRPFAPLGTQTRFANKLDELLQRKAYRWLTQGVVAVFMARMRRESLGMAGYQVDEEQPARRARYVLREWGEAMEMDKSEVRRILLRIVDAQVLTFDEEAPGVGWLSWQTDISRWRTGSIRGGARTGAGAPAGNQNARKYATVDSLIDSHPSDQTGVDSLIDSTQTTVDSLIDSTDEKQSNYLRPVAREAGQQAASSPVAPFLGVISTPEKNTEKKEGDTEKKHTRSPNGSRKGARSKPDEAEIDYRVALLALIAKENALSNPRSLPQYDGQWKAAGQFYVEHVSVDDALDFYRSERMRPYWRSNVLTLQTLFTHLGAWRADRAEYLRGIASSREAASGAYVRNVRPDAAPPPVKRASAAAYKTQDAHEHL